MSNEKGIELIKNILGVKIHEIDYVCMDGENTVYILKNGTEVSFTPNDFANKILEKYSYRDAQIFCDLLLRNIPHAVHRRLT